MVCPIRGGLAEILVVTLFLLIFTEYGSDDFERSVLMLSTLVLGGGLISEGSGWTFSINRFSHGFAAIQRSNQLQPQLFLLNSFLWDAIEILVRDSAF